jgi:hypothetical protein
MAGPTSLDRPPPLPPDPLFSIPEAHFSIRTVVGAAHQITSSCFWTLYRVPICCNPCRELVYSINVITWYFESGTHDFDLIVDNDFRYFLIRKMIQIKLAF